MLRSGALLGCLPSISAAFLLACAASAQTYPDRAIRVVVPFSGGSASDVVARLVLDKMGPSLGQQFVIENQPGAGGNDGSVADGSFFTGIECNKVFGREPVNTVGIRFEVVDEPDVFEAERFFDVFFGDDPWKIGHGHSPLLHGASDAEAGITGFQFALAQKLLGNFFKARIITAGKGGEIN